MSGEELSGVDSSVSSPPGGDTPSGLKLLSVRMTNVDTGQVVWESDWDPTHVFQQEMTAHVPSSILSASAVSRTLVFYSERLLEHFSVKQVIYLMGSAIEEWNFDFGFVIPDSTNSWESTVVADQGNMLPAHVLNGNVIIVTTFYDEGKPMDSCSIRVFYDEEDATSAASV